MSRTNVASKVDLESVINTKRAELDGLVALQSEQVGLERRISLIINGKESSAVAVKVMRRINADVKGEAPSGRGRRNGKTMGDIMFDFLSKNVKSDPNFAVSTQGAIDAIKDGGYKGKSKNPYNVVRQMLVTDGRFKARKVKGKGRAVAYSLADH